MTKRRSPRAAAARQVADAAAAGATRVRELKQQFLDAHAEGMRSLRDGNLRALGRAIARESRAIHEQSRIIKAQAERTAAIVSDSRAAATRRLAKKR